MGAIAGPWLFGGVRLWSVGSLLVLTFLAGALWGVRPVLFRVNAHPVFPAGLPYLALFLLYAAMRTPSAAGPYEALLDILRCAGLVLAFWIWSDLSGGHHGRWRWLIGLLLLSAAAMSLYAIIQNSRGSNFVLMFQRPDDYGMRASGAFMCPNHFACFVGMLVPVAYALITCRDAGYVIRIFCAYALVTIPVALYLTQSRSGWLGVLVGLCLTAIVLAARRGRRAFWMTLILAPLVAAALAMAAWAASPMVRARINDAMQGNPRIQLWKDTLNLIREAPLMGHGAGSFRLVYPRYWHELRFFTDPEHTHNEPLEAIAEHGFVGAGILTLGIVVVIGSLLARVKRARREKDTALIAGVTGATAAVFVQGLFDFNLRVFGVASTIVMLAGIATSGLFASGDIARKTWFGSGLRKAAGIFVSVACLILAWFTVRAVLSYIFVLRGDEARMELRYEVSQSNYEHAITADRRNPQAYLGYGHLLRTQATWCLDPEQKRQLIERAEQCYNAALARNPNDLRIEASLGLLANLAGDDARALKMFQAVVSKAPLHRDNLCRLGLQLKRMGRREEALDVFRRARLMGSTEMIEINLRQLNEATMGGK